MKTILSFFFFCFSFVVLAQDTNYVAEKHSKFKIGGKFIAERAGDAYFIEPTFSFNIPTYIVYSGGIQVVRQIRNSMSSLESGVYLLTKAEVAGGKRPYHTLSKHLAVPLNYRVDIKIICFSAYISGGPFIDYLVQQDYVGRGEARIPNAGANINLGIEKSVTKSLSILVEARYMVSMHSTYVDYNGYDDIVQGYTNYGIAVGINYKIPNRI